MDLAVGIMMAIRGTTGIIAVFTAQDWAHRKDVAR